MIKVTDMPTLTPRVAFAPLDVIRRANTIAVNSSKDAELKPYLPSDGTDKTLQNELNYEACLLLSIVLILQDQFPKLLISSKLHKPILDLGNLLGSDKEKYLRLVFSTFNSNVKDKQLIDIIHYQYDSDGDPILSNTNVLVIFITSIFLELLQNVKDTPSLTTCDLLYDSLILDMKNPNCSMDIHLPLLLNDDIRKGLFNSTDNDKTFEHFMKMRYYVLLLITRVYKKK